jgi:hypothetical protein
MGGDVVRGRRAARMPADRKPAEAAREVEVMTPCPCGKPVRLRAVRIRGRNAGVGNWIEHYDGSPVCTEQQYEITAIKPYPPGKRPSEILEEMWENDQAREAA